MNQSKLWSRLRFLFVIGLTVGIFAIDLQTPLGYAEWLLYLIPVLLAFFLIEERNLIAVASACTMLVILGFFISPEGVGIQIAAFNRLMGVITLWILTILLVYHRRAELGREQLPAREQPVMEEVSRILERVSDAFVSLDKNWHYTYVNEKAAQMFNRKSEELIGKHIWTEFPEGIGQPFHLAYERAMAEQKFVQLEGYYPPYDRWFENRIYPSKDGLCIFFHDITERKQAEDSLRDSELLLRETGRMAKVGGWEFDPVTLKGTWTEEVARIHDLDPAQETNVQTGISFYKGESRRKIEAAIREAIEFGKPYDLELEMITAKGNHKWVRTIGTPLKEGKRVVKVRGSFQDITERKLAELALRESEERYRRLLELAPVGIAVHTEGRIAFMNRAGAQLLGGSSPQDLVGRHITNIVHPDNLKEAQARIKRLMDGEQGLYPVEDVYVRLDGSPIVVEVMAMPLTYQGKPAVQVVVTDITERKGAESELKLSRERLRRLANRLQTIREEERKTIAREIHDELGQELTALKMDVSLLAKRIGQHPSGVDRTKVLEDLRAVSSLVDETIQTVRRIATELRPEVLDRLGLAEAIRWQAEEFQGRSGIRVRAELPARELVLTDEQSTALFRIYQESLTNIARHSQATTVATLLDGREGRLILEVADNGRGITAAEIEQQESLGLLGIRERARLLGGEVQIVGSPGGGTTVKVTVPLASSL